VGRWAFYLSPLPLGLQRQRRGLPRMARKRFGADLGCYGDGGALFTDDDGLAETMRAIRTHGGIRRHHYPKCLHEQPVFAGLGYRWGDFPEAERASREVLSLPMHPYLTEREQERVIVALQGVLEARASFHPGAVARSGAGGGGPIGV